MAAGFLRRLFRSSADLPQEVQDAVKELERIVEQRPALAGPAALLGDILPGLYEIPVTESAPKIPTERATAKWASGLPLLRGEALEIDLTAFARRWRQVCAAVQRHQDGPAAAALAEALRPGRLEPRGLVQELLAGRPHTIHDRANALGLDAALTATVLRMTLFPILCRVRGGLTSVGLGCWEQGFCPICGSWPLLGEFRGLEQTRFLRCGWCAADWEFPRLRCPFCACTDHRQLGYLHIEGEEAKYRAATCDACRGYVKMASSLFALKPAAVLSADATTMHLDLVAAERGYGTDVAEIETEPGTSSSHPTL